MIEGIDVHALAEPTKLEQLQKDFKSEKKDVKEETKQVRCRDRIDTSAN